jgi:hypothetical protein
LEAEVGPVEILADGAAKLVGSADAFSGEHGENLEGIALGVFGFGVLLRCPGRGAYPVHGIADVGKNTGILLPARKAARTLTLM